MCIKASTLVEHTSNSNMSFKALVFFVLFGIGLAERPYVGLRIPDIISTQIVGGSEAPKGGYPFIVSLQIKGFSSHFCAGSILNNEWILTAAHCVQAVPANQIVVKAGKHNIKITENTEQTAEVEKSFKHEQYGGGVGPYDVGLIKLKSKLKFTKEVRPIELPEAESEPTGDAILCGWGSVSQNRYPEMPDLLQHITLQYVSRPVCHESVKRLTGSSPVHETNVCTGPLTGGISACSGDSGGPLINYNGKQPVLTGVVSWGIIPCGTVGAPSVYAKVSKFNGWIQQKIANN